MNQATEKSATSMPPDSPVRICVAILAAGASERFNGIKALAPVYSTTMLGHIKNITDALGAGTVFAVVGAHWQSLLPELTALRLPFVVNSDWSTGQRSSVATAARNIAHDTQGLLVLTVDQIGIDPASLQQLLEAFTAQPEHIVCAAYADTRGVPAIFPRRVLPHLTGRDADRGAQHLLFNTPNVIVIDMPTAALDIDHRHELVAFNRARDSHNARS